ncbi:MAG: hypothetical protein KKB50_19595 [Planctomycetes bacterium]|nr:hypothetical protein [Planctomycetota bacterium]
MMVIAPVLESRFLGGCIMKQFVSTLAILALLPTVMAGAGLGGPGVEGPPPGSVRVEGVIASTDTGAWQITVGTTAIQITADTILRMQGQPITFDDLAVGQTVAACGVEDDELLIAHRVTVKYGGAIINFVGSDRATQEIVIAIAPHTLLLGFEQGGSVVVHADIPYAEVNADTLALDGIAAAWAKPDDCGNLVAYFDEAAVKAIVAPPSATLTLTGETKSGSPFTGSDTVQVKVKP